MRNRPLSIIGVLLVIILIEFLTLVHLRASLIDVAATVSQLDMEIAEWRGRNSELREEYLRKTSYQVIQQEVEDEGFVPSAVVVIH